LRHVFTIRGSLPLAEQPDDHFGEFLRGKPIHDPAALLVLVNDPGIPENPQMTGQAGLAQTRDPSQKIDAGTPGGRELDTEIQTVPLPERLELGHKIFHGHS
jgi:hypothetical protein